MERGFNSSALAPGQLTALVEASKRARKVRRCAAVATLGGWTTAVFGGLTLLWLPLSFSWSGLFIGAALVVTAWGEFHGASLVRRFDPRGARRLALNQLVLGSSLVLYAMWCLLTGLSSSAFGGVQSGDPNLDAMIAGWSRVLTAAVYGMLVVLGVVAPGLTAWYYATRAPLIRRFRAETDASVIEALKAA